MPSDENRLRDQTIEDFGYQWSQFGAIDENTSGDFLNDRELLVDFFQNLLKPEFFKGKTVCEVGTGSGRLTKILKGFEPATLYAVEPAKGALKMARKNLEGLEDIHFVNSRGDDFHIPEADIILSIGVIHHIPDPLPVINNIYLNLKKGGYFLFWVYGKEGNSLYLLAYKVLSLFTKSMNSKSLMGFCRLMALATYPYGWMSRYLPLPMHQYFRKVLNRLDVKGRSLVIFDQLNPTYAKYYSRGDVEELVANSPFEKIEGIKHRNGYSWTVLCKK